MLAWTDWSIDSMKSICLCLACCASLNAMLDCMGDTRSCIRPLLSLSIQYLCCIPSWLCADHKAVNNSMFATISPLPTYTLSLLPSSPFQIIHSHTHTHSSFELQNQLQFSKLSPTPQQPARTNHHHRLSSKLISPAPTCHVEAPTRCLATLPPQCLAPAALALEVPIPATDTPTIQAVEPKLTQAVTHHEDTMTTRTPQSAQTTTRSSSMDIVPIVLTTRTCTHTSRTIGHVRRFVALPLAIGTPVY